MQASDVPKISRSVKDLAEAVLVLVKADEELTLAKARIPDYTGGNSRCDYVADEQAAWNRAAQAFHSEVIRSSRN